MRWLGLAAPLALGACHAVISIDDYEAVAIVGEWRSVNKVAGVTADMVLEGDGEGSGAIPTFDPTTMTIVSVGVALRWEHTDDDDIFSVAIRCADVACGPMNGKHVANMLCESRDAGQELFCVVPSANPEEGHFTFTFRRR